jgi:alpha 1,2-mannosyltransferase
LKEFDGLNAKVISLDSLDKEASADRTKSFHIKGSAFTSSSFTEILYLDSDSIPTRSPEFLFDSKEFKEFGAVFWGDFWKDTKENAIWRVIGIQCRDEWTMESGQVLIDKSRHLDA